MRTDSVINQPSGSEGPDGEAKPIAIPTRQMKQMDIESIKRIGIAAAYKSGKILKSYIGNPLDIREKGVKDLVTEADLHSERNIIRTIKDKFPDHAILAEESGANPGDERYQWIIDPLDGTINFAHQLPFFSISIAFALEGKTMMGVVFNPVNGELFSAISGQGALLNNAGIRVSKTKKIGDSLLATGFPYNVLSEFKSVTGRLSKLLKHAQGIRRLGSAALDLCYVGCGRLDGYWEQNLKAWDTAAGVLIATEAGAVITDFSNAPFTIDKNEIAATNGNFHDEMISLLQIKGMK
jgi:myo-inositol-1(or 4)-monophosphatase